MPYGLPPSLKFNSLGQFPFPLAILQVSTSFCTCLSLKQLWKGSFHHSFMKVLTSVRSYNTNWLQKVISRSVFIERNLKKSVPLHSEDCTVCFSVSQKVLKIKPCFVRQQRYINATKQLSPIYYSLEKRRDFNKLLDWVFFYYIIAAYNFHLLLL